MDLARTKWIGVAGGMESVANVIPASKMTRKIPSVFFGISVFMVRGGVFGVGCELEIEMELSFHF